MKVYCKDCAYLEKVDFADYKCVHPKNLVNHKYLGWLKPLEQYSKISTQHPSLKNKDNNCKDYKQVKYSRIL